MRVFLIYLGFFWAICLSHANACTPPQNFRAEIFGSTFSSFNVALTWEHDCPGIIGYRLEYRSLKNGEVSTLRMPLISGAYIMHLSKPDCYEFRLYSDGADGVELPPVTIRLCSNDLCPPPTNYRLTRVSPTRAVVTWDAVPNASQYVVYVRPVGGKTTSYPGASNTRTLVGLKPEKEYEYRIRTLCPDKKTSAFTEWKRFTTPKPDLK